MLARCFLMYYQKDVMEWLLLVLTSSFSLYGVITAIVTLMNPSFNFANCSAQPLGLALSIYGFGILAAFGYRRFQANNANLPA